MPSIFNSTPKSGVGQTKTVIYTASSSPATTSTIIGCTCSNTGTGAQHASVYLRRSSVDYSIVTNGNVPVGNTLAVAGIDGKLVLIPGDSLVALCDAGLMDTIVSALEQS